MLGSLGTLAGYGELVHSGGSQDYKNLCEINQFQWSDSDPVQAGNIGFGMTCPLGAAFCQFAAGAAQS